MWAHVAARAAAHHVRRGRSVEFRIEVSNNASTFGRIQSMEDEPRLVRFGMNYPFRR
jgi:hypothetical protein